MIRFSTLRPFQRYDRFDVTTFDVKKFDLTIFDVILSTLRFSMLWFSTFNTCPHSTLPLAGSRVQNHDQEQSKWIPRQSFTNSVQRSGRKKWMIKVEKKGGRKMWIKKVDDFRDFFYCRHFQCRHFSTVDILESTFSMSTFLNVSMVKLRLKWVADTNIKGPRKQTINQRESSSFFY